MTLSEPEGEPTQRQWTGYWSMIVQQTQNAFNDKAAQFILIPLGGAVGYAVESIAGLMIAIPFVLFAPLAGWMSDRFSKRNVIIGAAIAQVAILALISTAVFTRNLPLALVGFFLLAVQSAFFSPAKIGINKELVGSKHLGFAAGVQQMTSMLAILAGQIIAGWWYDHRYISLGGTPDFAWSAAILPLLLLTSFSVPAVGMALAIPKVPAHGREKLGPALLIGHFKDLKDLWADGKMRRASLGVAYFWGFAAFINLWSVKVAKSMTSGGEGFGTLSSIFMAAASLGMAIGFGTAAWLLRRKIELGWVPLAGILMTIFALSLALLAPGGWPFLVCLALLAFSAALFLAPLNAWMQDRYPPDKRGELQSAANLQDCFAGILAVAAVEGMIRLFGFLGLAEIAGFRWQLVVIAITCALMTGYVIRLLPADLIRLVSLFLIRLFYRIKLTGANRIPSTGGVLLLPNHVTFADAFFISAACSRPVRFVMDETFMASPAIRLGIKLFGGVPIRRDQPLEAIRTIISALEKGDVIALFPEGRLTRTGGLSSIERGFELIARKAKAPIFPLYLDGSWGSIFSYERGKFFRKTPYKVPYGLSIAIGSQLPSHTPACADVQAALMRASADALTARFSKGVAAPRRSAYQLTQLAALPRDATLHLLEDELDPDVIATLREFALLTRSRLLIHEIFLPSITGEWIGAARLRDQITSSPSPGRPVRFHDFSPEATLPLSKKNLLHLPALAISGRIVAMSMEDPPLPKPTSTFQPGRKPGTYGKILPGLYVQENFIFPGELPLPDGARLDPDGFLTP